MPNTVNSTTPRKAHTIGAYYIIRGGTIIKLHAVSESNLWLFRSGGSSCSEDDVIRRLGENDLEWVRNRIEQHRVRNLEDPDGQEFLESLTGFRPGDLSLIGGSVAPAN